MYENNLDFAINKDKEDSLNKYRNEFLIPTNNKGEELIYLCGNSLGLQPKKTSDYIQQELNDWAKLGVEGHTDAKHPWLPYHEFLTNSMSLFKLFETFSKIIKGVCLFVFINFKNVSPCEIFPFIF